MSKYELRIEWPWVNVPDTVEIIEVPEGADPDQWCAEALEIIIHNQLATSWELAEDDE